MTIRKEFEAWANDNKLSLCRNAKKPDEYAFCAQKAWLAWQAAFKLMREMGCVHCNPAKYYAVVGDPSIGVTAVAKDKKS